MARPDSLNPRIPRGPSRCASRHCEGPLVTADEFVSERDNGPGRIAEGPSDHYTLVTSQVGCVESSTILQGGTKIEARAREFVQGQGL